MYCPRCGMTLARNDPHKRCPAAKRHGAPPNVLSSGARAEMRAKRLRGESKDNLRAKLESALRPELERKCTLLRKRFRAKAALIGEQQRELRRGAESAEHRALAARLRRLEAKLRRSIQDEEAFVSHRAATLSLEATRLQGEQCVECGTSPELANCTMGVEGGLLVVTATCPRCGTWIASVPES